MEPIIKVNFSSFDLNLLRVFDALYRERSVTRSGDLIGLSQPAVSNALSRLRHHLTDELFVRRGNEMVPTQRAEIVAPVIRAALANLEDAIAQDDNFRPEDLKHVFTLYGADFVSMHIIPELFARITGISRGVSLRMLDSATGDPAVLLRNSVVDLAIERAIPIEDEWISSSSLMRSGFMVVARHENPHIRSAGLVEGDVMPLELFCSMEHAIRSVDGSMSGIVDDALSQAGFTRRVVLALPHFQAVAAATTKCNLIATIPTATAQQLAGMLGLLTLEPPVELMPQELQIYWHRRHDRSPIHRWLRDQVYETVKEMSLSDR